LQQQSLTLLKEKLGRTFSKKMGPEVIQSSTENIMEFDSVISTFEETKYISVLLTLPMSIKVLLFIYLLDILLGGLKYRWIIISYLLSPMSNQKLINRLIWIEQILGLTTVFNIFGWIVMLFSSGPIPGEYGHLICTSLRYTGNLRHSGLVIWSCLISCYRVVCIKANRFLRCSEKKVCFVLFGLGFTLNLASTLIFSELSEGKSAISCNYKNILEKEIVSSYKVYQYIFLVCIFKFTQIRSLFL